MYLGSGGADARQPFVDAPVAAELRQLPQRSRAVDGRRVRLVDGHPIQTAHAVRLKNC